MTGADNRCLNASRLIGVLHMRDLYSVLRVARNANETEIKFSFRNLVKTYHPDRRPHDRVAQQRFREIVHAYECLSDRSARKRYDAMLADKRRKARRGSG